MRLPAASADPGSSRQKQARIGGLAGTPLPRNASANAPGSAARRPTPSVEPVASAVLPPRLFHYKSPHVARRTRLLGSSKSSFSEIKTTGAGAAGRQKTKRRARRTLVLFEGGTKSSSPSSSKRRLSFTHRADSVAGRFLLCLKGGALALRKGVPWDGGSSLGAVSPVARGKQSKDQSSPR